MKDERRPSDYSVLHAIRDMRSDPVLRVVRTVACACLLLGASCIDLGLGGLPGGGAPGVGGGTILPGAFVISGTMVESNSFRPCPVFEAESSVQFHLVRADGFAVTDFNSVTRIGASSVLEVILLRDVDQRCQVDDLRETLEITAVLDVQSP